MKNKFVRVFLNFFSIKVGSILLVFIIVRTFLCKLIKSAISYLLLYLLPPYDNASNLLLLFLSFLSLLSSSSLSSFSPSPPLSSSFKISAAA